MRSKVEEAALAWREARLKACAAPVEGFAKDRKGDSIAVPNLQVWTDLGAAETALSEAVKAMLDRQAEWEARVVTHVVHGMRYQFPLTVEAYSLEGAIDTAWRARESGEWWPVDVRTPAGEIILNEEKLDAKVTELDDAMIEATCAKATAAEQAQA